MNNYNFDKIEQEIKEFINDLNINDLNYLPSKKGYNKNGQKLQLGFFCYALKTLLTLNDEKIQNKEFIDKIKTKINSFQIDNNSNYDRFYIDQNYANAYKKKYPIIFIKNIIKFFIGRLSLSEINPSKKFYEFIRAETKQSIATISEFNLNPQLIFNKYPKSEDEINNFIHNLDWRFPWNAGAQVSGICVFSSFDDKSHILSNYINLALEDYVQIDGAYYSGELKNNSEKINGAMKVITGLEWLSIPIHKPKELIDTCLNHIPNNEGCDLVDVVYVLYKCLSQTKHREAEVQNYLESLIPLIMSHYKDRDGGFAYFKNKSQEYYYGVKITNGFDEADIHGTTLLTWALAMIFSIIGEPYPRWKIIRP